MRIIFVRSVLLFLFLGASNQVLAQNIVTLAEQYAQKQAQAVGIHPEIEWRVSDAIGSTRGIAHVYLQQTYRGIDVEGSMLSIHLKNGKVMHHAGGFVAKIAQLTSGSRRRTESRSALQKALQHLSLFTSASLLATSTPGKENEETFFALNDIARKAVKAELIYMKHTPNDIRLAWDIELHYKQAFHVWSVRVDALSGVVLSSRDQVLHCDFGAADAYELSTKTPTCSHHIAVAASENKQANLLANTYRVLPLTVESPNHGSFATVSNPAAANATASPNGWHDDGNTNYTSTRGNNVLAQEDLDGDDSIGTQADGGAALDFNFVYDNNQAPSVGDNLFASITNLFYWNNIMHDIFYNYGFDEVSGNFQSNNFNRGGTGNDYVIAHAQDGLDTNNANFYAPLDGQNPIMQMFLWDTPNSTTSLQVNSPAAVAGNYPFAIAQFGPSEFSVTGDLVFVSDNSAIPSEGCLVPNNAAAIAGNIAMIDRGSCEFGIKVLNAENAGAIAAIICNNVGGNIVAMAPGVNGASVTIPSIMISQADCATIRAELPGVNVTIVASINQVDSDFDNGIISHEYGHGISIRLTGGRNNSGCLNNAEQMGEGWSDFFGLAVTSLPSHTANTARGIGTYAISQAPTGGGIRPYPYTRNMSINPTTYGNVSNLGFSQPHGIGSIWCTMLWDMYWDLVDQYGYDTDLYNGTGGNNIAMRLVTEACKFQSCQPGFVDGRDAILAADEVIFNGANQCVIWEAFARRGLGYSADQGNSNDRSDGIEAFDLPPSSLIGVQLTKTANNTAVGCDEVITFTLAANAPLSLSCIPSPSNIAVQDILPDGLSYVNGSASDGGIESNGVLTWPILANFNSPINYTYQATVDCASIPAATPTTIIDDDVENSVNSLITTSNSSGLSNWLINSTQSFSGSNSWYAQELEANPVFQENQYLTIGPMLLRDESEFSFQHLFDTEDGWDGGQVEISIDDGATWQDLGNDMTQNPYNSFFNNNPNNAAFSGLSNGNGSWIETKIDLSDYEGCTIRIRFRFYYDAFAIGVASNSINDGWYIDDIKITTGVNTYLVNKASLSGEGMTFNTAACIELNTISVALKTMLKGAYTSGVNMNAALGAQSLLPNIEPYTSLGYVHAGGGGDEEVIDPTVLSLTGNNAIVDWVLVELRSPTAPATIIASRSALLQADGDIVDIDGISPVSFYAPAGNYHVAVRHRNHLGVMTGAAVSLN